MDYEFFQALTAEEAQTFLNRFLEVERQGMKETRAQAARDGVHSDYSIGTLSDVLKWIVKQVRVHRVPVPEEEPWWIRQCRPRAIAHTRRPLAGAANRARLRVHRARIRSSDRPLDPGRTSKIA